MRISQHEVPRYLAVGIVVTVANVASYAVLTEFMGLGHKLSYSLMFVLGVFVRFTLERRFVFEQQAGSRSAHGQLWRFGCLVVCTYLLGLMLFQFLESALPVNHFVVLAMVVASTTIAGFLGSKHLVFARIATPRTGK